MVLGLMVGVEVFWICVRLILILGLFILVVVFVFVVIVFILFVVWFKFSSMVVVALFIILFFIVLFIVMLVVFCLIFIIVFVVVVIFSDLLIFVICVDAVVDSFLTFVDKLVFLLNFFMLDDICNFLFIVLIFFFVLVVIWFFLLKFFIVVMVCLLARSVLFKNLANLDLKLFSVVFLFVMLFEIGYVYFVMFNGWLSNKYLFNSIVVFIVFLCVNLITVLRSFFVATLKMRTRLIFFVVLKNFFKLDFFVFGVMFVICVMYDWVCVC